MKKLIAVLFFAAFSVYAKEETKDLGSEISETITYTKIIHDDFYGFDGEEWSATARMFSSDGSSKLISSQFSNTELINKLVEDTAVKQSDIEEVLNQLKDSIESLTEEDAR